MKRFQKSNTCSLAYCLLLLCILTSGQADCPKPPGKYDIVLTNESLLKNAFPEGSEATFECANGYVRDAGSGTVTCTAGKWSEPDISCKKKDCGPLRALPHVRYNVSEGTLFGAKVKVSCDDGYYLIGSSFRQCYSTGWSGRTKCEVVTCDMPSEIANGKKEWHPSSELPKFGDIINYTCDEGYTLIGNSSIECNKEGEYSSPPPECKVGNGISTLGGITTRRHTSTTPLLPTSKAITTTTALRGGVDQNEADQNKVETNKNTGFVAVAASVLSTLIVVLILLYIIHRCLLKRKGSYYTGEDLNRESLQLKKHELLT